MRMHVGELVEGPNNLQLNIQMKMCAELVDRG